MMSDSFLFEISSVFFGAWTLAIMAFGVAAFGRDLLPSKAAARERSSVFFGAEASDFATAASGGATRDDKGSLRSEF